MERIPRPAFLKKRRRSRGATGRGVAFEAKVHRDLEELYGDEYSKSPWFKYNFEHKGQKFERFCSPDGLLFKGSKIHVLEMKLSHCEDAFYQLIKLYVPVVSNYFGSNFTYHPIEVVRWYDAAKPFPVKPIIIHDIFGAEANRLSVRIWPH